MRSRHNYFFFLALIFLISSCGPSLSPFTQKFYDSYSFDEQDLKKIQFYVSKDIILRKAKSGGNVEIEDGAVKVVDGKKVNEVIIRKGTPGLLMFIPKEDRFAISFDDKDDQKYLIFGPNRRLNNHYALLGSDWSKRSGTVTYGGEKYYTSGESGMARLMIDLKAIRKIDRQSSVARGREIR